MKKLIFIITALILLAVGGVAAWQIYVPVHEDNVSIQAYEDLRQFVELPVPDPLPQPSTSESIPPSISPTQSPNSDSTVTSVPQVDFESLRAVNPEIVAWLTIDGTNINYPITQHSDNDYYLHHLFTGEYNSSGCLFMDCRNPSDFSACHTIYIWSPYGQRHHVPEPDVL